MLDADALLDERIEPVPPPSGRGFWIVVVALVTACALVLVGIFANRPLVGAIARAESELRRARALAEQEYACSGTFAGADARSLSLIDPQLKYVDGDVESPGLGAVSVFATDTAWAAAIQARPGACFFIRIVAGEGVRYGGGTTCTGRAALAGAVSDAW